MATEKEIIDLLQRYNALKSAESPWPEYRLDEGECYRVDWGRLFPPFRARRRVDQENEFDSLEVADEGWNPDIPQDFLGDLERDFNREEPSEDELEEIGKTLLYDTCAWYQPIHFFTDHWGIFIREDCILSQARLIGRFLPPPIRRRGYLADLAQCLIRASVYAFFLREHYHHKIESLGLRLHVVDRKSCYLPYQAKVYSATRGTDAQLEEALANADSYRRLDAEPYRSWITYDVVSAAWDFLRKTFPHDPPGYRMANNYLKNKAFESGENTLHGQVHEASLTPSTP